MINIDIEELNKLEKKGDLSLCGFHTNIDNLKYYNNALQFFVGSPYDFKGFSLEDYNKLEKLKDGVAGKRVFIHSKYVGNISKHDGKSINPDKINIVSPRCFCCNVIYKELKLLDLLNLKNSGTVLHLSKGYNSTKIDSLSYTSNILNLLSKELLKNFITENNYILIETSNSITSLGSSIDDLIILWNGLDEIGKKRVKFCIDTNHLFATGYPINTVNGLMNYLYKFEKYIGLSNIKLFHLNDSKYEILTTNKEHALIGNSIFPDFKFLNSISCGNTNCSSLENNNTIEKIKSLKETNLNLIKSISNYLNIPVIFELGVVTRDSEEEDDVLTQLSVYNSLDIYPFENIINNIYFRIIVSEFERLENVYSIIGDKKINNCYKILSLLRELKNYKWCVLTGSDDILKSNQSISEDLSKIKGFGEKTISKILYIIAHKKMGSIEKLISSDLYKKVVELTKIPMIGPVTAKRLIENGINDFKTLYKNYKKTNLLTRYQKKVISIYKRINNNLSYKEIEKIETYIRQNITEYEIYFLGSYSRKEMYSSDIDILIVSDDCNEKKLFLEDLSKLYEIVHVMSGDKKSLIFIKIQEFYVQIDIILAKQESRFESKLYLTGPKGFNIWLRMIAKEKKYTLNENSLFINKKKVKITNDREIFKFLGLKYISPEKRSLFESIS